MIGLGATEMNRMVTFSISTSHVNGWGSREVNNCHQCSKCYNGGRDRALRKESERLRRKLNLSLKNHWSVSRQRGSLGVEWKDYGPCSQITRLESSIYLPVFYLSETQHSRVTMSTLQARWSSLPVRVPPAPHLYSLPEVL